MLTHLCNSILNFQDLFYLQLIFAIPSCLILRLLGATRYLALSLILWGAITIGMAFITNAYELIILRFFLVSKKKSFISDIS
jgi:small-conductance mechanosensitive channel